VFSGHIAIKGVGEQKLKKLNWCGLWGN